MDNIIPRIQKQIINDIVSQIIDHFQKHDEFKNYEEIHVTYTFFSGSINLNNDKEECSEYAFFLNTSIKNPTQNNQKIIRDESKFYFLASGDIFVYFFKLFSNLTESEINQLTHYFCSYNLISNPKSFFLDFLSCINAIYDKLDVKNDYKQILLKLIIAYSNLENKNRLSYFRLFLDDVKRKLSEMIYPINLELYIKFYELNNNISMLINQIFNNNIRDYSLISLIDTDFNFDKNVFDDCIYDFRVNLGFILYGSDESDFNIKDKLLFVIHLYIIFVYLLENDDDYSEDDYSECDYTSKLYCAVIENPDFCSDLCADFINDLNNKIESPGSLRDFVSYLRDRLAEILIEVDI